MLGTRACAVPHVAGPQPSGCPRIAAPGPPFSAGTSVFYPASAAGWSAHGLRQPDGALVVYTSGVARITSAASAQATEASGEPLQQLLHTFEHARLLGGPAGLTHGLLSFLAKRLLAEGPPFLTKQSQASPHIPVAGVSQPKQRIGLGPSTSITGPLFVVAASRCAAFANRFTFFLAGPPDGLP